MGREKKGLTNVGIRPYILGAKSKEKGGGLNLLKRSFPVSGRVPVPDCPLKNAVMPLNECSVVP